MKEITLIEAIREAYIEEMKADDKVFMVGQDIRGGNWPSTLGLVQEVGEDRILDTPIAETAMYGAAMGAAQMGYRPIVDFMFGGFAYVAASEIMMQSAQYYFLHGGQRSMPLVITGAVGAGFRLANEHAACINSAMLQHPGIKVAFPSNPYDAKGLMKSAIRDNNPVVLCWHMGLMMEKGMIPEEEYVVPLGVAEVKREGGDITVVASGLQVKHSLAVAEELAGKVDVEVIDLRSLEPLDLDAVLKSLEKTSRLVVVDEDTERCGFGGELMAQVVEKGFDLLDAPMARVCNANIPIPGGLLEPLVVPSPEKIAAAIQKVMDS